MLGLNVYVRGRPPVSAALAQDDYVVIAGAAWRRDRPGAEAEWLFHTTGIDDRGDSLRWLWLTESPWQTVMDVRVVDVAAASPPRRLPRRRIDWSEDFERMRVRDIDRVAELEATLRRVAPDTSDEEAGHREAPWQTRPPGLAYKVTVNGVELGRIGVRDPGSLSVEVVARRRPQKQSASLHVHGGDRTGPKSWRWRGWSWSACPLAIGDQVRLEVVKPVRLSLSRFRKIESSDVVDIPRIARELKDLRKRLRSNWYQTQAVVMSGAQGERLPPRRYPRR
jgi:hypothetical protein